MIFDYKNKEVQIKIVYYGPAMSGKTTSIKHLFSHFERKEELISIDNTVGRTLFFDFGVLKFQGSNWSCKFLVYSSTGQDFYSSTRPATLNGADGLIFVLDSQIKNTQHNLRSWKELVEIFGKEFYHIPIVICLNKYDLNGIGKIQENDFRNMIDYNKFLKLKINKTIATEGVGVINSFFDLVKLIFPQINLKYEMIS